jgi:solute carrier family 8 (sodium/calcium exchanger)
MVIFAIVVILQLTSAQECLGDTFLPAFPGEAEYNPAVRAIFYFLGMLYFFLGVSIAADKFMEAIGVITSKTRKIVIQGEEVEILVWNETVANLTLMALGSSAPEILLATIETVALGFEAGELGPGTIVGSAAFNLLVICAICVMAIPNRDEEHPDEEPGIRYI